MTFCLQEIALHILHGLLRPGACEAGRSFAGMQTAYSISLVSAMLSSRLKLVACFAGTCADGWPYLL